MVKYESAHIEEAQSEFIVRSGHSCQADPSTIAEVRRIFWCTPPKHALGTASDALTKLPPPNDRAPQAAPGLDGDNLAATLRQAYFSGRVSDG